MSEKSMFFNSTAEDIREYSAEDMSEFFGAVAPDGVLEGLKVSRTDNKVYITPGKAIVDGRLYVSDETKEIEITETLPSPRYDRIILRLDKTNRTITIARKTGTDTVAPELVQSSNIYEISLAVLLVASGIIVSVEEYAQYSRQVIYSGKDEPDALIGNSGDIYVQYD